MRIVKAYHGKYIAYRAWFNGKLIWSYGDDTMGDLVAALNAVAKPEPEVPDAILLQGEANTRGAGLAEVWELDPVLTQTGAGISSNATPRAAETVHPMAAGVINGRATARPYTYGTVFTRGHAPAELSTQAKPNTAEAVRAVGVADFGNIDVASRPRPEEVPRILAAADATIDAPALPVPQEPEGVVLKTVNGLVSNAGALALKVHTVTFMVDGEIEHQERVIHGYACPDPVATGKIAAPTKEMTVSHTYEHSGWEAEGASDSGSEIQILPETTLSFEYNNALGVFGNTDVDPAFVLEVGQDYTVVWDGNQVTRTAFAFTFADGSECVGVGNPLAAGQESNDDLFCVVYDETHNYMHYLSLEQTDSHTIAIYQGEASGDSTAGDPLSCVTRDIVVYPTFTESIRYYTVRFWDGDTLVDTVSVPYGGTAVTTYTKPGYKATWEPSGENITTDTDCYGKFEVVTFKNSTWAEIAAISEAGQAAECFKIGDSKTITVDNSSIVLRIIGFDHDTLADGSGKKAGMTIFAETALSGTTAVPNWTTVANFTKNTLKPQLPSDLQAVIKPVLKKCDDATLLNKVITPTEVEFELFPLSWDELKIRRYAGRKATDSTWRNIIAELGTPYTYFANKYNSTYWGPNVGPFNVSTGTWFRQYFRMGTDVGLQHTVQLISTSSRWAYTAAITEKREILFAFCV